MLKAQGAKYLVYSASACTSSSACTWLIVPYVYTDEPYKFHIDCYNALIIYNHAPASGNDGGFDFTSTCSNSLLKASW